MLSATERGKLDAIRRRLRARHAAIDADPALSPHGKRVRRAREQLAAEDAARKITEASDARHARASRDAYFKCFGLKNTSADGIQADRAARETADRLGNPGDALRMLAQAELRGDTGLSRAIAEQAWQHRGDTDLGGHWAQVLLCYADADPQRNAALGGLAELDVSPAEKLTDNIYRSFPRPPDLQTGSIEALAAEAEPQTAGSI